MTELTKKRRNGSEVYNSLINCPPVGDERVHPAQKPVALIKELLRVCGDHILDPFAGSGATGIACRELGKRFTGFEIDSTYCDLARKGIEQSQPQPKLFTPTPEPMEQGLLI